MIGLLLSDRAYEQDIRELLMAFYPGETFVHEEREDLDLAVKASLMPRGLLLGVVQRMDFNGLDVVAHGLENQTYTPAPAPDQDNIIARHYQAGELGVKSGSGFYDYGGQPYQEVLERRDRQLIQSVRLARAFLDHPLANPPKK